MDYRQIIESRYNRKNWQELLFDIFHNKAQFYQQPQRVPVDANMAKSAYFTGKITLPDGHTIAVYEVELSDSVVIERNRAGIRNLLCTNWRGMCCSGAFMFCYRQHESVLRFSYVSEAFTFTEDGSLKKDSTDTKRFTYLLGEGYRCRTAIKQFEDLKKSALDLKAITKAFSVEALSDLFFKEYKKQYEDIIEFVTGKRMVKVANKWEERLTGEPCDEIMQGFDQFPNAEKAVRDYVKKLMGRLVFIQFLQKKGWMGCSAGEAWNDGDREFVQNLFANTTHKSTFVDDVLEPLFNDINTKRAGDISSSQNVGRNIKIPYLNGGLFETDGYDRTKFPLPAKYMKSLLDFLASYNFTIDENDPDDAEIGVDPEMLGRIFENLLKDNKDKGAFYTPKEIVQYMCRESLIAYLQTDVEDEAVKSQIREFVTTNNPDLLSPDLVPSIDQKLKDVKICDPAIGSGAFPMGLLRELYACRKAIEGIDDETAVRIKTEIIQNNIYGVDIEKGAVDIARLRFWLSLILDEETPHALPNLDFKIMQGNSLLERYEGVELSGMSLDEQKKRKTKKGDYYQTSFAFDEKIALENIQKAIKQYYLTDNHETKVNLRKTIDDNVKSYILNLKGNTPDIQRKLENLPIPNDQFFLWHIYFKEVFDKGGFDIVIGNPPYIQLQADGGFLGKLYQDKGFETFASTGDIYCLFYELGHKLLKSKGYLCFITSNKWMRSGYGEKLRSFFASKTNPLIVLDFGGVQIFETANIDTVIVEYAKAENQKRTYALSMTLEYAKEYKDLTTFFSDHSVIMPFSTSNSWIIKDKEFLKMKNHVELQGKAICDWDVDIYRGIITGLNDAFYLNSEQKEFILNSCNTAEERVATEKLIRPMLRGKDIKPYTYTWADIWLIGTFPSKNIDIEKYPSVAKHLLSFGKERLEQTGKKYIINGEEVKARKKTSNDWFETSDSIKYWNSFDKPKIIYPNMTKFLPFVYDEEGIWTNQKCFILTGEHLGYLTAFFNSKLFKFLFSDNFPTLGEDRRELSKIFFDKIPVKDVSDEEESIFKSKVLEIQNQKKLDPIVDTSALEAEIDRLVYDLYGLTEEEIKIIEGTD